MTLADGRELAALKFLDGVSAYVRDVSEPEKALRRVIRDTREFLGAAHACIATHRRDHADVELLFALPKTTVWDVGVLGAFIRKAYPPLPADMAIAAVQRRGRAWGAIALRREDQPFDRHDRRLLTRVAAALSEAIHRIDRDRTLEVRNRIDRKIMEQLDPKDLFYQILDGLRSLTQYDHSSALLIREETGDELRLVAEQIAWTKARSERIGLRLPMGGAAAAMLRSEQVYGFDRHGDTWRQWKGDPAPALALMLDYGNDAAAGEVQHEASMLCAPLVTRDGLIGMLKIAARHPGSLNSYDAELVEHFRSQAAVAIQNLHRTESLRARVLTAERKHAMADLARSVSHDVNNALGSMLPLVQQMQDDIRAGVADAAVLAADLEQMQKSLQVCRRIFGGMLSFARGSARRHLSGHVRRAADTASAILKYGMARQGIELSIEVPEELPAVACGQNELEQVFLNLLTNARDATPRGGAIVVNAVCNERGVHISVADTGGGIAAPDLPRVMEPFFSTKPEGHGLGLSICRSILWEVNSALVIQSDPASGTRVEFVIPVAQAHQHLQSV
jgi:two-component system, NtrC family, sensor kinase